MGEVISMKPRDKGGFGAAVMYLGVRTFGKRYYNKAGK